MTSDQVSIEIGIHVDGHYTWREARWETKEISTLYSERYGVHRTEAPVLRPILRDGERLFEPIDGPMLIKTLS